MPSTCARAAASGARRSGEADATKQQQLITRLLLPVKHEHLKRYCQPSLTRISAEYGLLADTQVLRHLREHIPALSLTNDRALFFILLNIDTNLKQTLEHKLKEFKNAFRKDYERNHQYVKFFKRVNKQGKTEGNADVKSGAKGGSKGRKKK